MRAPAAPTWGRLAVAVLLAACGGGSAGPTAPESRSPPVPTTAAAGTSTPVAELSSTTSRPPPTTVPEPWTIRVELDAVEALTLGPGVSLAIAWPGGAAEFTADAVALDITGAAPRPDQLTFRYPEPERGTDTVGWSQPVPPVGETLVVRQPWRRERGPAPGGVLLAWQAGGDTATYVAQLDEAPGLTVASPVWWTLDADGSLRDRSDARLVEEADVRGIALWPAFASLDGDAIRAALGDPGARSLLAATIVERTGALGAGGVNLDLEGYRLSEAAAVTALAEEMADRLHESGLVLSVDVTPRSDTWTITPDELDFWSIAPQRRALAAAADYTVLMAYDQFNAHRPAGPVAAPAWVEETLRYQLRYADPDRVLLGVPFYFRLWDPAALDRPRAIAIAALDRFARGERRADSEHGLDRVDRPDGTYLWVEDAAGLRHRTDLVAAFGLGGLAAWRLGLDGPDVWGVVGG